MDQKLGYRDILQKKEYMKLICASLVNRFGDSIDAIAFTWLVYELTGSAAWSTLIFGINRLPSIFIMPFAGAWVEGKRKKQIMIWMDIARAACVAYIATGYLFHFLQPWMLVVTTLLISTAEAFRIPAGTALTPKILEKEYYEYGMSLMSSLSNVVEIAGMVMAGGIVAFMGISGAIYIDMATFLLSAIIIMTIKVKEEGLTKTKLSSKEYLNTLSSGVKYVGKSSFFRFFTLVCILLNAILVPFNSLQAPMIDEIFGGGAMMLSVMSVAATVGMLIGSVTYPWIKKKVGKRLIFGFSGFGIAAYYMGMVLCRPLFDNVYVSYSYLALTTALLGYFTTLLSTFMSVEFIKGIDEEYLARASALSNAADNASMPMVSFIITGIISFTDVETIFILAAIVEVVMCLFLIRSKELDEKKDVEQKGEGYTILTGESVE